jgi:hypothetical protein
MSLKSLGGREWTCCDDSASPVCSEEECRSASSWIISLVMRLSAGTGVLSSGFCLLRLGVVEWAEVAGVVGAMSGVDSRDSRISLDEAVLFVDEGL